MLKPTIFISATFLMLASAAHAAIDGGTGTTSSGRMGISLTISEHVRLQPLMDVRFRAQSGLESAGSAELCVFASQGTAYSIRSLGGSAGDSYPINLSPSQISESCGSDEKLVRLGVAASQAHRGHADTLTLLVQPE